MRIAWLGLFAALIACGKDDGNDSTTTTGTPTGSGTGAATGTGTGTGTGTATGSTPDAYIDVGNGEQSHTPLSAGAPVVMVHGPQNGWHIDVSGEVHGLGSVIGVEVRITRADNDELVASNGTATFLQLAGYDETARVGWFAGERAGIDRDQAGICALEGVALNLCAVADDLAEPELVAEGCVQATAALHPYDVPVCAGTATGTGTGTGTGASSTGGGTVP